MLTLLSKYEDHLPEPMARLEQYLAGNYTVYAILDMQRRIHNFYVLASQLITKQDKHSKVYGIHPLWRVQKKFSSCKKFVCRCHIESHVFGGSVNTLHSAVHAPQALKVFDYTRCYMIII